VPVGDPDALREALVTRLSDREGCRAEGLRAWLDVFDRRDVRLTGERVARVYQDVLSGHQRTYGDKGMTISH
jgi:hypothetical protein